MEQMLNVSSNPHVRDKIDNKPDHAARCTCAASYHTVWYLELRLPCTSCCTRDGCVQRLF